MKSNNCLEDKIQLTVERLSVPISVQNNRGAVQTAKLIVNVLTTQAEVCQLVFRKSLKSVGIIAPFVFSQQKVKEKANHNSGNADDKEQQSSTRTLVFSENSYK